MSELKVAGPLERMYVIRNLRWGHSTAEEGQLCWLCLINALQTTAKKEKGQEHYSFTGGFLPGIHLNPSSSAQPHYPNFPT